MESWQEVRPRLPATDVCSPCPGRAPPAPRLASCSALLLRQDQDGASGPMAFRKGETEAQSHFSHLPVQAHCPHTSRDIQETQALPDLPPGHPHLEAHWQEDPRRVSVAQVYPTSTQGGCWLAAAPQGARLSGAQEEGSVHRGVLSSRSPGPSQALSECQL